MKPGDRKVTIVAHDTCWLDQRFPRLLTSRQDIRPFDLTPTTSPLLSLHTLLITCHFVMDHHTKLKKLTSSTLAGNEDILATHYAVDKTLHRVDCSVCMVITPVDAHDHQNKVLLRQDKQRRDGLLGTGCWAAPHQDHKQRLNSYTVLRKKIPYYLY